jgi:hypothetical protein
MARPQDSSLPRLAVGCRWANPAESEEPRSPEHEGHDEDDINIESTVLFPEGAIRVQGTGKAILRLCDGQKTFQRVIAELQTQYILVSPTRIREDAEAYLEKLHEKRIVDY